MRTHALLSFLFLSVAAASRPAAAQPAAPAPLAPASGASVQVPLTIRGRPSSTPARSTAATTGRSAGRRASRRWSSRTRRARPRPATSSAASSNGTYFWRVQAVDNAIQASAWSAARSFTVTGAGPGTPGTPVLAPTRGLFDVPPLGGHPLRLDGGSGCRDLSPRGLERPELPGGRRAPGRHHVLERQHPDQQRRLRPHLRRQLVRPRVRGQRRQPAGRGPQPALERHPVLLLLRQPDRPAARAAVAAGQPDADPARPAQLGARPEPAADGLRPGSRHRPRVLERRVVLQPVHGADPGDAVAHLRAQVLARALAARPRLAHHQRGHRIVGDGDLHHQLGPGHAGLDRTDGQPGQVPLQRRRRQDRAAAHGGSARRRRHDSAHQLASRRCCPSRRRSRCPARTPIPSSRSRSGR